MKYSLVRYRSEDGVMHGILREGRIRHKLVAIDSFPIRVIPLTAKDLKYTERYPVNVDTLRGAVERHGATVGARKIIEEYLTHVSNLPKPEATERTSGTTET